MAAVRSYQSQISGRVDLAALQASAPAEFPFLLQSAAGHPQSGRFDLLLWAGPNPETLPAQPGFFEALSARVAATPPCAPLADLPFAGGWFVYLGYEAAQYVEPSLQLPASPQALPTATAVRCRAAVLVDRSTGLSHAVSELSSLHALKLLERAAHIAPLAAKPVALTALSEDDPAQFLRAAEQVLGYLQAGDTFQINLSRRWQGELAEGVSSSDVYAALCAANPAPFAALAHLGSASVLSSSPERLLSLRGNAIETRPIAGTRPRGSSASQDADLQAQLQGSLKERAEHVMLIDLERNDLGRVCLPGSVEVNELMALESYTHVHHIVSNVRGTLRPDVGVGQAIAAVFPGGTITGCPKVRAMQIIAELEGVGRGAYTGALGYISRCGQADLNILIRTLVVEGRSVSLRAGAGIVADSNPELELAETRAKAKGLLRALGVAA